jgi:hypothetical protein
MLSTSWVVITFSRSVQAAALDLFSSAIGDVDVLCCGLGYYELSCCSELDIVVQMETRERLVLFFSG